MKIQKNDIKIGFIILIVLLLALFFTTCLSQKTKETLCDCSISNSAGEGFIYRGENGQTQANPPADPVHVLPGGNGRGPDFSAELYDFKYDSGIGTLRLLVTPKKPISNPLDINTYVVGFRNINNPNDNNVGTVTHVEEYTSDPAVYLVSIQGTPLNTPGSGQSYTYSISNRTGLPGTVNYPFESGIGTNANPFTIENIVQFDALRYYTNSDAVASEKYFQLNVDLEYPEDWNNASNPFERAGNDDSGWSPIGSGDLDAFDGKFNGNDKQMTGFFIDKPALDYVGIFGSTASASKIENITVDLTGQNIVGKSNAGSLAGSNGGSISNAEIVVETITGNGGNVGGLTGSNFGSIFNANVTVKTVTGQGDNVGGFAGYNLGTISTPDSFSAGTVTSTGNNVGGFVGNNAALIENSVIITSGTLEMTSPLTFSKPVFGNSYVGGMIGHNTGKITNMSLENVITVTSEAAVSGTGGGVGGFMGYNTASGTTLSYITTQNDVTAMNGAGVGGLIGVNTGDIMYASACGNVIGNQKSGGLLGTNSGNVSYVKTVKKADGTAGKVTTTGSYVGGLVGQNSGNISYAETVTSVEGVASVGGLIGHFSKGSVSNCQIGTSETRISIQGNTRVGGLAGNSSGDISSSVVFSSITASSNSVGGLVGDNEKNGQIIYDSDSLVDSSISAPSSSTPNSSNVGGLVGNNAGTMKINSSFSPLYPFSGNASVGGLAGSNGGTIEINAPLTFSKPISGNSSLGGVIGYSTGKLTNQSATNTITVTNDASVTGTGSAIGGFIGNSKAAEITYCYVTTQNNVTGTHLVGGLIGIQNITPANNVNVHHVQSSGTVRATISTQGEHTGSAGGLFGLFDNGNLSDSTTSSIVVGENCRFVGGLVGNSTNLTIENCSATGSVTGNRDVGGLVGRISNSTSIQNNSAHGSVIVTNSGTSPHMDAGGLIGRVSNSTIQNCYAEGSVNMPNISTGSFANAGGLIGSIANGTSISNCYASGDVKGYSNIGGLIGNSDTSSKISSGVALNSIIEGTSNRHRILGTGAPTLQNNYALQGMIGGGTSFGLTGIDGENVSSTNSKSEEFYDGTLPSALAWDFTTPVWKFVSGSDYPRLSWET
ncbi:beta strand repeat-containing protein [Methanolapillus ohkumae]|uniref:GLUG domain-containing protein n=1 Tax=Methanolapillus ohkumae TaxID=3028298 RepID=A0AA96V8Y0_9EURY|nr:hypothetical protein MsAm2_16240 [Methanosarcinaceae archaeon Am2]